MLAYPHTSSSSYTSALQCFVCLQSSLALLPTFKWYSIVMENEPNSVEPTRSELSRVGTKGKGAYVWCKFTLHITLNLNHETGWWWYHAVGNDFFSMERESSQSLWRNGCR
ncbi:hypothetical protein GOODEAATRI_022836 [Goodea atripinnis]|uniref:Uncharacterized protein n=1 Tax=Goodea atripinnis TaxID=208336 RepID=A0ABV0PRB7_9TELE